MNYAVVGLPLLSNAEQCADACMRLRAEYFYQTGQYNNIQFQDVNGHTLHYRGGASREALHRYLRHLYGVASTFSLSREMQPRTLAEIQPGDVFVYPGKGQFLGHAVLVVDVAVNKDGKKAFLLAEAPPRLRHSSHPQLRKPISLPVVHDRRQREEIPLVSHPLQSNRLEA